MKPSHLAASLLLASAGLSAQLPQGWFLFSTFGSAGQTGLFMSHPRTPAAPTTITGLSGDLIATGASCVLYRASDDAILCGERAQVHSSVDLHVIRLRGSTVLYDASFSVGTGGTCCGEIPQMGLLPDGRVVVAATDIESGPLSMYKTTSYGYQGLGIVDTTSGSITPVPITNGASIVDVFNGMAVAPDFKSAFLGTYVSSSQGDIYQVPIPAGGQAKLVATVPDGLSNMAFDNDGNLWVTTLSANALFKINLATGKVTHVPQTNGALNGIANEATSGNLAVVSSSGGLPTRSLFWMEPDGTDHLLTSPGLATPSGVDVYPNPARIGLGTPTAKNTYSWELAPNPGGLPEVGNLNFSLTVTQKGDPFPAIQTVFALCADRMAAPINLLGADIWVDLSLVVDLSFHLPKTQHTIALPIPNMASLKGVQLFAQTLHVEATGPAGASAPISFSLL